MPTRAALWILAPALPLSLVTARALAQSGHPLAALAAAGLALLVALLALAALLRQSAHRPTAVDRLRQVQAQLRAARPDVPADVIDAAETIDELAGRLVLWDEMHRTGAAK